MTEEQNQDSQNQAKDRFHAEFEALPLDKKFASLFKMEAATLTETVEYVFNSPMEVVGKVGDAISDFAGKVETEFRKATKANQAEAQSDTSTPPSDPPKPKGRQTRKRPTDQPPN